MTPENTFGGKTKPPPMDRPWVYPSVLNRVYSIGSNSAQHHGSQGVYETGSGTNYSPDDLSLFQGFFNITQTPIARDIGGANSSAACKAINYKCSEANLDVQFITAVAQDLPTWFWYSSAEFGIFLATVASTRDAPLVLSISYGEDEFGHSIDTTKVPAHRCHGQHQHRHHCHH